MLPAIFATHPKHLTTNWAQRVVASLEEHQPINVTAVALTAIDIGTTTRVRLAVTYDRACVLPKRWFVKLPSLAWRARLITALPQLLPSEVRFYQDWANAVPVAVPYCLAAQTAWPGSVLVLADLHESGARPGLAEDCLTVEQAETLIAELAKLHARFWLVDTAAPRLSAFAGSVRQLEDQLGSVLAVPLMRLGLARAGRAVPAHLRAGALRYAQRRRQVMRFLADAPHTLVHHDCHPGNVFWQDGQPGLLDWQMARIGEGVGDVAYLLATGMAAPQRREHEQRLLAGYVAQLAQYGITGLDVGELFARYRAHSAYAFEAMVVTLAVGGLMQEASNLELIRRTAAAVDELDAFAALPLS